MDYNCLGSLVAYIIAYILWFVYLAIAKRLVIPSRYKRKYVLIARIPYAGAVGMMVASAVAMFYGRTVPAFFLAFIATYAILTIRDIIDRRSIPKNAAVMYMSQVCADVVKDQNQQEYDFRK